MAVFINARKKSEVNKKKGNAQVKVTRKSTHRSKRKVKLGEQKPG
jgi:hypothetical protein